MRRGPGTVPHPGPRNPLRVRPEPCPDCRRNQNDRPDGGRPVSCVGEPGRLRLIPTSDVPSAVPSLSVPPHAGTEAEGDGRQQRDGRGEARQVRLHSPAPRFRDLVVGPAAGRPRWNRGPWLCVPASRRVCPGRPFGGGRFSSSLRTLRTIGSGTNDPSVPVGPGFSGRFPDAPEARVAAPAVG